MVQASVLKTVNIISTPGVLGGKPRIDRRRVSVQQIAAYHAHAGWSVNEISAAFKLSLAEIHAALSYYYDHQDEIDKAISIDSEWAKQLAAKRQSFADEDMLQQVMTAAAVAEEYKLSPRTVRDAIEHGWIEAIKSGGTWLLRRADVAARWGERK